VLTTDASLFGNKNKQPAGEHVLNKQYKDLSIGHRLAPPRHPQTNGMFTFNHHIPQRALEHIFPVDALKFWGENNPNSALSVFINRRYLTSKHQCGALS